MKNEHNEITVEFLINDYDFGVFLLSIYW